MLTILVIGFYLYLLHKNDGYRNSLFYLMILSLILDTVIVAMVLGIATHVPRAPICA